MAIVGGLVLLIFNKRLAGHHAGRICVLLGLGLLLLVALAGGNRSGD